MASIASVTHLKAFKRFLLAMNQQAVDVFIAKVTEQGGGDPLAFGLGGTRSLTKVKLSPSPYVEDLSRTRDAALGAQYVAGDMIVNFIPPVKLDGSAYTEDELNQFDEIWFGPIANEGTPQEAPAKRLYVRRYPNMMINGRVVICNWVANATYSKGV